MYIFNKTRLKLTAWYLLIIMLISISFSVVIYKGLESEVERFARIHRMRIERQVLLMPPPLSPADLDLIKESKQRIILILAVINGVIFVISGALGYVLAGKTLKPIQEMVDEQNRFISDASHELRTPLTSLKTAMEVNLRDKNLTLLNAKKLISESVNEVDKLQLFSEELLQLSQYQTPNGTIPFEVISVTEAIKKAVHKMLPVAKQKQIEIKEKVGEYEIKGSAFGITDVFVILLDNAIKYSPRESTITVETRKTGNSVFISVTDEGMGIEAKDLPHIFDRFYRADYARSRTGTGGYGLGLSIAKKIVDAHHGSIHVESKRNTGSVFTVSLPLISFS